MSMHKADVDPRKDFIASTAFTVVMWSVFTMCAGFSFFGTELLISNHIDRGHVAPFFILALAGLLFSIPYSYTKMRWAVCERCFSYVCFKKDVGACKNCEARYVQFGKNTFRDRSK